jgi:hypothetical protein
MYILLAALLPLAMLVIAFSLATGRSIASPESIARTLMLKLLHLLRWLWKPKDQHTGAGRARQPRIRYYE